MLDTTLAAHQEVALPPRERWERVAAAWSAFGGAHEVGWSRFAKARTAAMWVACGTVLMLLAISGTYRGSVWVTLSCLVLLAWWYAYVDGPWFSVAIGKGLRSSWGTTCAAATAAAG